MNRLGINYILNIIMEK